MRKKETSIRDVFAKVADNLNKAGVLPPVSREWTAKGVQSAYYRGVKNKRLNQEIEKVKNQSNYK